MHVYMSIQHLQMGQSIGALSQEVAASRISSPLTEVSLKTIIIFQSTFPHRVFISALTTKGKMTVMKDHNFYALFSFIPPYKGTFMHICGKYKSKKLNKVNGDGLKNFWQITQIAFSEIENGIQ